MERKIIFSYSRSRLPVCQDFFIINTMKLYATITSERATKGQGGKKLSIEICGADQLPLIAVDVSSVEDKGIKAKMFLMGDSRTAKTLEAYPPEDKYQSLSDGGWIENECQHFWPAQNKGCPVCQKTVENYKDTKSQKAKRRVSTLKTCSHD